MTSRSTVLIIDDEEIMREVFSRVVADGGHQVFLASSGEEGLELMRREPVDLVLLDLMLPGIGGLETLEKILELDPDLAVIMVTAYASIENAVQATRLGAFDFVTKPFRNEELLLVIKNGIRQRRLELENRQLKSSLHRRQGHFQNIVGKSEPIRRVTELITQVGSGPQHGSDHRGERYREGIGRQGRAQSESAARLGLRPGQQRLDSLRTPGK